VKPILSMVSKIPRVNSIRPLVLIGTDWGRTARVLVEPGLPSLFHSPCPASGGP
jgi:hypothetical protein